MVWNMIYPDKYAMYIWGKICILLLLGGLSSLYQVRLLDALIAVFCIIADFLLFVLSSVKRRPLESTSIIVDMIIFHLSYIHLCLMYFNILLLDT